MTLLRALLLPVAVLLIGLAYLISGRGGWMMALIGCILAGVDTVLVLAGQS